MDRLDEDNYALRAQLQQYRNTLENTERVLSDVQKSIDVEESKWITALTSSEQECNLLKIKVTQLTVQVKEFMTVKGYDNEARHSLEDLQAFLEENLKENNSLKFQLRETVHRANESERHLLSEKEKLKDEMIIRTQTEKDLEQLRTRCEVDDNMRNDTCSDVENKALQLNMDVEGCIIEPTECILQSTSTLIYDNTLMEDDCPDQILEIDVHTKEVKKQTVLGDQRCSECSEVEQLHIHISKIEKELLEIQGKHFELKGKNITAESQRDDRLNDYIENHEKTLCDLEFKEARNCNYLRELKKELEEKEFENQRIKAEVNNISLQLKEARSHLHSEKENSCLLMADIKTMSKDLLQLKTHMEDIKKEPGDVYHLNEKQIEEDGTNETAKKDQCQNMNIDIMEVSDKLKKKDEDICECKQINEGLKRSLKDLHDVMFQKEEQFVKQNEKISTEARRLIDVIRDLETNVERKKREIENRRKKEKSHLEELAILRHCVEELNADRVKMGGAEFTRVKQVEDKICPIQGLPRVRPINESLCSELEEIKRCSVVGEAEIPTNYRNIEHENSLLREFSQRSLTALNDREKELCMLKKNEASLQETVSLLEGRIEDLNAHFVRMNDGGSSNPFEVKDTADQVEESIKELHKNHEYKSSEIEDFKNNETSMLQMMEELENKKTLHRDLILKYNDLTSCNTHLEFIIHDLHREINEKEFEIEDLKEKNACLFKELSSLGHDRDELYRSTSVEEEEIVKKHYELDLSLSAQPSEDMKELVCEVTELRAELENRETLIESLQQHVMVLANDNISFEKKLAGKVELVDHILELINENKRFDGRRSQCTIDSELTRDLATQKSLEFWNQSSSEGLNVRSEVELLDEESWQRKQERYDRIRREFEDN